MARQQRELIVDGMHQILGTVRRECGVVHGDNKEADFLLFSLIQNTSVVLAGWQTSLVSFGLDCSELAWQSSVCCAARITNGS